MGNGEKGIYGTDCFDVLMAEHGVDYLCSNYIKAVDRGEPYANMGLATDHSRSTLDAGFEALNIDCYTGEYLANSAQREALSARNANRVTDVFDSIEEGFKTPKTTIRCEKTGYGTIECREGAY